MPVTLNQPRVMGTEPGWWLSTHTRQAMASPIRIRYSIVAMLTWTRAVILMPMIAITSMMRPIATPMPTTAHLFVELEPKTAKGS